VRQNALDQKFVRNTRWFGVPTLIAVHPENNPNGAGFEQAKAYAVVLVVTKQEY
jgi:ketol-acid reductoisomerase